MNLEIIGKKIKLRPFKESDIEDVINWMEVETEWKEWDAPWEEDDFNAETYRKETLKKIKERKNVDFFYSLEIDVLETLEHVGRVNSYYIDENYKYTKKVGNLTIGIDIFNPQHRKQGFATEAWVLYIDYAMKKGFNKIYTQTWSENYPVFALMKKVGFECVNINKKYQVVKGKYVDGYTFMLNLEMFKELKNKIIND